MANKLHIFLILLHICWKGVPVQRQYSKKAVSNLAVGLYYSEYAKLLNSITNDT